MSRRSAGRPAIHPSSKPADWTVGQWLRDLRERRGWSQPDLARNMVKVAAEFGGTAELASLKPMISKWENDHIEPDQYNRHLLAQTLGVKVTELGLWVDPFFVWRKRRDAA
ncbi:helix-turn-helix domain-containing protein [Actinoplanes sp. CA-054009]